LSSLNLLLSGTILPWLLGLLLVFATLALLLSLKLWRATKRSPYFFMRQQAAKRMQSYLSICLVLLVLAGAVGVYGWRTPTDTTRRMALLTDTKPVSADVQELFAEPLVLEMAEETDMASAQSGGVANFLLSNDPSAALSPELPEAYDRYDPQADLLPTTELGEVALSSAVTDEYEAISPTNVFREGFYTLYATFAYEDMVDGLEWAWVWRHNGKVVDGGNELWAYGDDGPGYIFLSPEEGFQEGQYSLEIWVNGELLGQTAATMNDAAISAGN
jgi:hypothetical protein